MWNKFYDMKSFMDKGTMVQLRNLIDRRNVGADSEKDCNASDDFFVLVVECHIIAAAMKYFKMTKTKDMPSHELLREDLWTDIRKDVLFSVTTEIVTKFVDLEPRGLQLSASKSNNEANENKVYVHACELLSHGLLYLEFSDSIREGDGVRILHYWRFLMLVFKEAKRKNYAIEALNILSQYHFFFTCRQKKQLLWSRCVNMHGVPGRNIPGDLHLEHLNRMCKGAVENLCANKTPAALKRAGKCLGVLFQLTSSYDKEFRISDIYGIHSSRSSEKDLHLLLMELIDTEIFSESPNGKFKCTSFNHR